MLNLDPAKLLVIMVIVLIVVGPERLPRVARQLGGLLREFSRARERVITELKDQVPDLPPLPDLSVRSRLRPLLFDPEPATNGTAAMGDGTGSGAQTDRPRSSPPGSAEHHRRASDAVDPSMN